MKTFPLAAVSAALVASSALVAQNGLLYTPHATETSNQGAAAMFPQITEIGVRTVQYVEPSLAPVSAVAAPRQAREIMLGDHDGDGSYVAPGLYRFIDALLPPVDLSGARLRQNSRTVWFSPGEITGAVAGAPALQQSELGRVRPNGVLEKFITRAHIDAAFGTAGQVVDVDAAALFWPQALFLSFEAQVMIGGVAVPDGSIVAIPTAAIWWGTAADGVTAVVNNVMANSGTIIALEADVDGFVWNSGIRDNGGYRPGDMTNVNAFVGDLDGLEVDPQAGTFYSQYVTGQNYPYRASFPNGQVIDLIFCGLNLTGGGIVSTKAGGQIAVINGVAMGNDGAGPATSGTRVGLVTVGGVGSLNGLAVTPAGLVQVATECTGQMLGAGMLHLEWASPAGGVDCLCVQPGVVGAGGVDLSVQFPLSLDFPSLYAPPGPMLPSGGMAWSFPIAAADYAALAGQRVIFQVVHLAGGGYAIGEPAAVQFY